MFDVDLMDDAKYHSQLSLDTHRDDSLLFSHMRTIQIWRVRRKEIESLF